MDGLGPIYQVVNKHGDPKSPTVIGVGCGTPSKWPFYGL